MEQGRLRSAGIVTHDRHAPAGVSSDGVGHFWKAQVGNFSRAPKVEGMNNKIKSISHRSFGFRSAENSIAAIYHCCARLPLPVGA